MTFHAPSRDQNAKRNMPKGACIDMKRESYPQRREHIICLSSCFWWRKYMEVGIFETGIIKRRDNEEEQRELI